MYFINKFCALHTSNKIIRSNCIRVIKLRINSTYDLSITISMIQKWKVSWNSIYEFLINFSTLTQSQRSFITVWKLIWDTGALLTSKNFFPAFFRQFSPRTERFTTSEKRRKSPWGACRFLHSKFSLLSFGTLKNERMKKSRMVSGARFFIFAIGVSDIAIFSVLFLLGFQCERPICIEYNST